MILWPIPYPADIWIPYPATILVPIPYPADKKGLIPHPAKPHREPREKMARRYAKHVQFKNELSEFLSSISLYNDTWSKIFAKKNRYLGSFISALTETLKETGGECDRHIVKMSITTYRACFQYRPILSLALPIILFLITSTSIFI